METKIEVEQFTRGLKVSGYTRMEAREIVVSGMIGWRRKMMRREKEVAV